MKLISCETCQHRVEKRQTWQPANKPAPEVCIWHECHAHAPTVLFAESEVRTCWPQIELGDRCGEWRAGQ